MSTSSYGRRYEGRADARDGRAFWERGAGGSQEHQRRDAMRNQGRKRKRAREKRGQRAARGARENEKGKNERGGETGERDEIEIQKVLTS